jgi:hypothetical protein
MMKSKNIHKLSMNLDQNSMPSLEVRNK